MARMARVVLPHVPHHLTQRGNRRQPTFFADGDYELYRRQVADFGKQHGVAVWAYCLMPNHVHLIVVPETPEGLAKAIGGAHQRYSRLINRREDWTGYLWQGRFHSAPLDDGWLYHAVRYVELNPVRARLVKRPEDYPWSSATAHLAGRDDELVTVAPVLKLWPEWDRVLADRLAEETAAGLRLNTRTGRVLGSAEFVEQAEALVGRRLRSNAPGRPRKK